MCSPGLGILLFADALAYAPETVGADGADHEQVGGRTETAGGQVALVLDGLVAAGGRHILRHGGRVLCVGCAEKMGAIDPDAIAGAIGGEMPV